MSMFIVVDEEFVDAREVFNAAMNDKYPGELAKLGTEGYEDEMTDEKVREVMEGLGFKVYTEEEIHRSHLDED